MDYNNLTPEQMSAFAGQPISLDTVYRKLLKIEKDISNLLDAPVKPANGVTISDLKWGQNTVKIYGHEWYDNGIWKLEIFDPFDKLIFEYKINDNGSDKDYTFEEFIEEAMVKYNASRLSV